VSGAKESVLVDSRVGGCDILTARQIVLYNSLIATEMAL
jgi:hypothetical protein